MSIVHTLGTFTIALMGEVWETRQTRSPKIKSFIADIVGDPNGRREVAGLPYDAKLWGVKQMAEFNDWILQVLLKGFEELSMDISLKRFWSGYGGPAYSLKQCATVAQKRTEWLGIGKILISVSATPHLIVNTSRIVFRIITGLILPASVIAIYLHLQKISGSS